MYIDNLTIAGVVVASLYGLLPLFFGRKLLRVDEDDEDTDRQVRPQGGKGHRATQILGHDGQSPCASA